jgi:predicted nucleic-acid-binding protein
MSVSVDTNILVRLLVADDTEQANRARKLFEDNQILIVTPVILETEWVLRSAYGFDRQQIGDGLVRLFGLSQVCLSQPQIIRAALKGYKAGQDFADALHLASSELADRFATFDQKLIQSAARLPSAIKVMEP